jgi:hypothetical protein
MENQNTDAAKKAAELNEERMHPIFEECEVMVAGKPAREHMLSMNGMYISGITDAQLKEMHGKLTEMLTEKKPRKYYYAEISIPLKTGEVLCKKDFVVETDGDKFPLVDALLHAREFLKNHEHVEDLDFKKTHICCCFEISKKDYEGFNKYHKK